MLTIVPLDTVRAVFEFLDLESLDKCRKLCKYMKDIIDHDYIINNFKTTKIFNYLPEELRQNWCQVIGKSFIALDSLTLVKQVISFNDLQQGDHIWVKSKDRHVIMLGFPKEPTWDDGFNVGTQNRDLYGLIIEHSDKSTPIYNLTPIKAEHVMDPDSGSITRLNYNNRLEINKIRRIAACLNKFQKIINPWMPIQYAIFCTTGNCLSNVALNNIWKDIGKTAYIKS
ncbi:MAG: F-box protein [Nitrososphaerota archaeon]